MKLRKRMHGRSGPSASALVILILLTTMQCGGGGDAPLLFPFSAEILAPAGDAGGDVPVSGTSAEMISAAAGGIVRYGDEVSLSIPAGSLAADTEIKIEKINGIPSGASDGFADFGQAYKLSPSGTTFAADKPAILRLKYDQGALQAKGLSEKTVHIYYFDEAQGRYLSVAGTVDSVNGEIVAYLEHFTPYLPMARLWSNSANNAPAIASQGTFPATPRAGAPLYLRASVTDFDGQSSVARVQVCMRRLHTADTACDPNAAPGAAEWHDMQKELGPGGSSSYGFLYDETNPRFLDIGDIDGTALSDISYCFRAWDTVNAMSETCGSSPVSPNVVRFVDLGQPLRWNTVNFRIAAGAQRTLFGRATDNLGGNFDFVPGTVTFTAAGIGESVRKDRFGLIFRGLNVGTTNLEYTLQGSTPSVSAQVMQGGLACMKILDDSMNPFIGTYSIKEGHRLTLDILGYDDVHGDNQCMGGVNNPILVIPSQWTADANLGSFNSATGELYALDGANSGAVTAVLGDITAVQHFNVIPRVWTTKVFGGFLDGKLAIDGDTPGISYVAIAAQTPGLPIQVFRFDGSVFSKLNTDIITLNNGQETFVDIAVDGVNVYVAYMETATRQILVQKWDGISWTLLAGALNVVPTKEGGRLSIALDDSTPRRPYVAWVETTPVSGDDSRLFVKRWNGSAWLQVGGQLNQDVSNPNFAADQPDLAFDNTGVPYVTFRETDATNLAQLYVKRFVAGSWQLVGAGALNRVAATYASDPSIIPVSATEVYLAWSEWDDISGVARKIYTSRFDGVNWNNLGGDVSDAITANDFPVLGFNPAGTLYMAFRQGASSNGSVIMKHWNGSAWIKDGGDALVDTVNGEVGRPVLHFSNFDPTAAAFTQSAGFRLRSYE